MPDAEPINYRLDDLKLRWQQDPSSRLFLQLADEHRKAGQIEEAVAVLEQGLEHRPNDLSALVALGRGRLELERAGDAIAPLEAVVSRDPTHIVASKLLIEAHLQQGDCEQAAERLRMYRLLNDRDPELHHLEYRLQRLQTEDEVSTVAGGELEGTPADDGAIAVDTAVETPEPAEPAPAVAEAADPAPKPAAGMDLFPLTDEGPAPDLGALWRTLPTQRPAVAEPFAGLSSLDAASHWELLSREGIFAPPGAPADAEASPEAEPAIEAEPVIEAEPAFEVEPAPEAEPVAEAAIEAEPVSEPAPTDAGADEEPATVTLGELYMKQGHRDEAERIFRKVLEQDPGNSAALDKLARLGLSAPDPSPPDLAESDPLRSQRLSAADLLAMRSASAKVPEGLTAKKVLVLGNYVKHLRAAAQKHVS